MNTEMKQLGSRIDAKVFEALRDLSKEKRISMASLTQMAILRGQHSIGDVIADSYKT